MEEEEEEEEEEQEERRQKQNSKEECLSVQKFQILHQRIGISKCSSY